MPVYCKHIFRVGKEKEVTTAAPTLTAQAHARHVDHADLLSLLLVVHDHVYALEEVFE